MIDWLFSGMTILGAVLNSKGDKNGFRLNRADAFKYTSIEAVVKETILESRTKDLVENLSTLFLTLIDTYT